MKLMTKGIEKKLLKKAKLPELNEGMNESMNAEVIVKYFDPCGAGTWLITDGEKTEEGDWLLFGYCHIFVWEWGYVLLSELESVKLPYGMKIERDLHCEGCCVRELVPDFGK